MVLKRVKNCDLEIALKLILDVKVNVEFGSLLLKLC